MDTEFTDDITELALKGLRIPPCPAVMAAALIEAKRPEADFGRIAHYVEQDVGLSAPLLKLANSPFFGFGKCGRFNSARKAIAALGLEKTVNLISNVALRQNVAPGVPGLEQFWDRSSLTASIAHYMAAKIPGVSPDDAYIAALFHDCGIPVMMQVYPEYREIILGQVADGKDTCQSEENAYTTNHAVVGNLLARTWFLPLHVCRAILYHHEPTIFSSPGKHAGMEVLNLIGLIHMAEFASDEHLHQRNREWNLFRHDVLELFAMSEQEFLELKGDALEHLNGE